MSPKVSILMPVHNAATTLQSALESILVQTLKDWELIAVDDGSTDGSTEILREASFKDERIRVLAEPHRGLVPTLNLGLDRCRATYIARMDADDLMHPDRLRLQAGFLDAQPHLGLVGCLVAYGGDPAKSAGYALHVAWTNSLVTPEDIALNRFVDSPFPHPSVCFRRELPEELGAYQNGDYPEDHELWLRWMDAGVGMGKVPLELLAWNDLPERLSRRDPRYRVEAFFRMKAPFVVNEARRRMEALTRDGRSPRLAVWGSGRLTRRRAEHLSFHGLRIDTYIDIDPTKSARKAADGNPVLSPDQLPPPGELFVLSYVSTRGARDFIRGQLTSRGYIEGRDFLVCA
jgi:glycosyltransferase involved in cell wall biosynthesis